MTAGGAEKMRGWPGALPGSDNPRIRRFGFPCFKRIVSVHPTSPTDIQALDELTGGAFSAATSGERAARLRAWLQGDPAPEVLQQVYRELSAKDRGAARLLRERLDEIRRQRSQDEQAAEWARKAQALLEAPRLQLADALAWQRDAARAGAPLSREPLASLKARLAERVRIVEELQHRAQVQREAAVLLAQRIEVLSTKSWLEAQAAAQALVADMQGWQAATAALQAEAQWNSVEPRFAAQLEAARAQLLLVWEAFEAALQQARAAAADPQAPLPQVPVWAEELRAARQPQQQPEPASAAHPPDPQRLAQATAAVQAVLQRLEQELAQGHGKASAEAAQALRQALREHGRHIEAALERRAQSALAAAGELEGWQRWRADQLREELIARAEALLQRPEGQALGGRKMQEALRALREQWKQVDHGGVPNHALWRRFDEACNRAHKVVEAWLEQVKAQSAEQRARRLALIDELKNWAARPLPAEGTDWKAYSRELQQFAERWRTAGHASERLYAELQPQWKAALDAASAPLQAVQQASVARRQAMIEEATRLDQEPVLRIDAVRDLQQRWQAEAQAVPLERRQEQKLWEAFRQPIDAAFARKAAAREQAEAALGAHDRAVLQAAQQLQEVSASGDAQAIRSAMDRLQLLLQQGAPQPAADGSAQAGAAPAASGDASGQAQRRPLVAVRGDDRPGAARAAATAAPERARPARAGMPARRQERQERPRLGEAAFRAQREALEQAQAALRRLAAQAHGQALTQLLQAWERRDASHLPAAAECGPALTAGARALWQQALQRPAAGDAGEALLRLEIAAGLPTPAEQIEARRALQLQLLTRRHEPGPEQTWAQDVARVLAAAYEPQAARRLQQALKVLLRAPQQAAARRAR